MLYPHQWRIQDFPKGGAWTLQGGGGAWTHNFAEFSQKLHEIERIWMPRGGGRASLTPPLRSATAHHVTTTWTSPIPLSQTHSNLFNLDLTWEGPLPRPNWNSFLFLLIFFICNAKSYVTGRSYLASRGPRWSLCNRSFPGAGSDWGFYVNKQWLLHNNHHGPLLAKHDRKFWILHHTWVGLGIECNM